MDQVLYALEHGEDVSDDADDIDDAPVDMANYMGLAPGADRSVMPPAAAGDAQIPDIIRTVLGSPSRDELVGIARALAGDNPITMVFHTPVGDVRSVVSWASSRPDKLIKGGSDELLLVKLRSSDTTFVPRTGVELDLSFEGYTGRLRVLCLSAPQQLYPGVDLLCFLPYTNDTMTKAGKLIDGAPSVVSGDRSDTVSDDGEPVVAGEDHTSTLEFVKASRHGAVPQTDFDIPRPALDS